jgi:hypothetical protein
MEKADNLADKIEIVIVTRNKERFRQHINLNGKHWKSKIGMN